MAYDDLDDLLESMSGDDDDDVSVGGQEIIGAKEIIGKIVRKAVSAAMKQARHIDPDAVLLEDTGPGPRRKKILAGTTTSVGAGVSAPISFKAQENFRPEEFFIQGVNIDDFVVTSIKVGTEEQLVNTGEVPGDVFSPGNLRSSVHFKTMNPGIDLVVTVRNTSGGALSFVSAFIGTAVG